MPARNRQRARARASSAGLVMISERPPEVDSRAVPGHGKGDLLMGGSERARSRPWSSARPATASLSRSPMAAAPRRSARRSSRASPPCRPSCAARSPGIRVRRCQEHRRFSVESGVEVYFCDPQSPWQRGSNENTNGLLRQYFPKRASLAGIGEERLDEVAEKLNRRPRKTLGFATPAEKLAELIDGLEQAALSADLASAYGLRSTALGTSWEDARRQGWCSDRLMPGSFVRA